MGTGTDSAEIIEVQRSATERSPSDVLRLVVAIVVLVLLVVLDHLFGASIVGFGRDLLDALERIPDGVLVAVVLATRVLAVLLLGVGLVVALVQGRWRMLLTLAVAAAIAIALTALLGGVGQATATPVLTVDGILPSTFPSLYGLTAIAAVITAGAPWLSRRWRRWAWVLMVGLLLSRVLLAPLSFDSLRAVVDGWLAGALVLVILGAPVRRPTSAAVAAGLADVGLPLRRLAPAAVDARGSTPYFGETTDGTRLFIKVLGDDERSADLLFRIYRSVTPHDLGDERPFSSLRRAVEHEALVALFATQVGTRTPPFVALARAEPNGFVLVYEAVEGKSLDGVPDEQMTDELLREIWAAVEALHAHGIAHRDLRLANVFLGADGELWMIDFGFSEMAASPLLLHTDRAELLASTTTRVGADRALAAARAVVSPEALAASADRLRPWALSGATRSAISKDGLAALRAAVSSGR